MMARMFRKILLDFKYDNPTFTKFYHSVDGDPSVASYRNINTNIFSNSTVLLGSFSNERKFSTTPKISTHQLNRRSVLEGPLCCRNMILTRVKLEHPYAPTMNSIRHYSHVPDSIVSDAIRYNSGIFKIIAESLPVECMMEVLKAMHHNTGLPWWATIMLTTILTRTFIALPLTVHQHQIVARMENLKHEMKDVTKTLKMEMKMAMSNLGWDASYATRVYNESVKKEWKELIVRENCHPFKIVAMVLLQVPLWLGFSFSLRNFCYMLPKQDDVAHQHYLEFVNGGFGWMTNLTDIDHSFVLPVLFGLSSLVTLEVQQLLYKKNETKVRKIVKNILRVFTICMVPVLAYVPSCLTLFWTTNSFYTMFQTLLLLSPKFRRLGRVPKTDSEQQHPYSELHKAVKQKLRLTTKLN